MAKRLTRDLSNKVIGGVCSGLANYLEIDPTIVRLIFVFCVIFLGLSCWAYIIALILMPSN